MNKVMVVGSSAGAGKSTFARKLSNVLQLPVHHLDTLFWKPGWIEEDKEIFIEKQRVLAQTEQWIIEGNYNASMDIRLSEADTIVFIHCPLWRCLYQVVKRRIMFHGKSRPDLTEGCKEKIDFDFIWFIIKTYYPRQKKMKQKLKHFEESSDKHKMYVLSGHKEMEQFLATLEEDTNGAGFS
ncbi:topology modulation protein [Alkalihalobacillus sp. FSL R5-0424]